MSVKQRAGQEREMFSIFLNMKVRRLFSTESPHRGDSDEYIQHTFINKNPKLSQVK